MTMLRQLQQRVAAAIRLPNDPLVEVIGESAEVPRAVRLGVYVDAYQLRLAEALRSNYPKLHLILGDDDFFALSRAFVAAHPSQRASIRWFGESLPAFLATTEDYAAVPILSELARFEWALGSAFDAADTTVLDATALGSLQEADWPALTIQAIASFTLLDCHWNTAAVWRALNDDLPPPEPAQIASHWAIWRRDLQPHYQSLPDDEAALLAAMLQGTPLAEACEVLLPFIEEAEIPERAGGLIGQWLQAGWISSFGQGT